MDIGYFLKLMTEKNASDMLLVPYVASGPIAEAEGRSLLRAAINSVALSQIEERLLFGRTKASAELKEQARVTAELLRDAIRYRAK